MGTFCGFVVVFVVLKPVTLKHWTSAGQSGGAMTTKFNINRKGIAKL